MNISPDIQLVNSLSCYRKYLSVATIFLVKQILLLKRTTLFGSKTKIIEGELPETSLFILDFLGLTNIHSWLSKF